MPTNFELGQKLIQFLKGLSINFCALKVVKLATMLPAAANPVSVDPSKYGTKRKGSEEVHKNDQAKPDFIVVSRPLLDQP